MHFDKTECNFLVCHSVLDIGLSPLNDFFGSLIIFTTSMCRKSDVPTRPGWPVQGCHIHMSHIRLSKSVKEQIYSADRVLTVSSLVWPPSGPLVRPTGLGLMPSYSAPRLRPSSAKLEPQPTVARPWAVEDLPLCQRYLKHLETVTICHSFQRNLLDLLMIIDLRQSRDAWWCLLFFGW